MEKHDLEQLVGELGLYGVVELLADIASEKAAHIESNWQDRKLAAQWMKTAKLLSSLARKVSDLFAPWPNYHG